MKSQNISIQAGSDSNADNWINAYTSLNATFKKKFVFRMDCSGFFSEYNNMLFAMLYCLSNRIKFFLSSAGSNIALHKGLEDHFLPFCPEKNNRFQATYNRRYYYSFKREIRIKIIIYQFFNRIDYFTQDLWLQFRDRGLENKLYDIPELGIKGDMLSALKKIVEKIWRYEPETQEKIASVIGSLQLPERYIGIHIRSGDKANEADLYTVAQYMDSVKKLTDCKHIFVATDDYSNILQIRSGYPDYIVHTLCNQEANGYLQKSFNESSPEDRYNSRIGLFADVDVLCRSEKFIGTFSSNIGMFIAIRMGQEKCFNMDGGGWKII